MANGNMEDFSMPLPLRSLQRQGKFHLAPASDPYAMLHALRSLKRGVRSPVPSMKSGRSPLAGSLAGESIQAVPYMCLFRAREIESTFQFLQPPYQRKGYSRWRSFTS
jgi:hypothetical protein